MKKIAHVLGSKRLTADVLTVLRVAENLCERFSFDIIMPHDAEYRERFIGKGGRVITFDCPSAINIRTVLRFARYFVANPPDVVHTHVSLAGRVGARIAGVERCISTRAVGGYGRELNRWCAPLYNLFTTATVCSSACVFEELAEEGVRRDKILLCPPYLAESASEASIDVERHVSCPTLVCPLPMIEGFGQQTLIRAVARLRGRLNIRLYLASGGEMERECRLLASRLGVGERVEFCEDIMSINVYKNKNCALVLTHEKHWELPPVLLFEGALPIIASDHPQNKELLLGSCDFFLRGDEFSLERAIERRCLHNDKSSPVITDGAGISIGELCDFYDRLYSAL